MRSAPQLLRDMTWRMALPKHGDVIKRLCRRAQKEIRTYRLALDDPRTPKNAERLLRVMLVYLLSPLDLIPDAIPILGLIDDVILIPGLFLTVWWPIPRAVWADCR